MADDVDAQVDLSITTSPAAAYTPPDFRSQAEAYAQPGAANAIDASTGLPQPPPGWLMRLRAVG